MEKLRPDKKAFIISKFLRSAFIISIVFMLGLIAEIFFTRKVFSYPFYLTIIAYVFTMMMIYFLIHVTYKKEIYMIQKDKLIRESGSLFSDRQTELIVKNITHVTLVKPYLENKFFRTGSILIESAGSAGTEILWRSIDNPDKMYGYIQKLMQVNGFSLKKGNIVQEERPSTLGVFFETLKYALGVFFSVLFILIYLGDIIYDFYKNNPDVFFLVMPIALIIFGIFVIVMTIKSIRCFRNRTVSWSFSRGDISGGERQPEHQQGSPTPETHRNSPI